MADEEQLVDLTDILSIPDGKFLVSFWVPPQFATETIKRRFFSSCTMWMTSSHENVTNKNPEYAAFKPTLENIKDLLKTGADAIVKELNISQYRLTVNRADPPQEPATPQQPGAVRAGRKII